MDRHIPNIHRIGEIEENGEDSWCLSKTHFPFSKYHPNFHDTAGFIYILRNPKDVLLSNLKYMKLVGNTAGENDTEFSRDFIENLGVKQWIQAGIGSWPSHVDAWLRCTILPNLFIHYEDMIQSPAKALRRAISFLGLDLDDGLIHTTVDSCSLINMKKLEAAEKRNEIPSLFPGTVEQSSQGIRFVNKGKTGQSLAHIHQELDQLFDEAFHSILVRLQERIPPSLQNQVENRGM